MTKITTDQAIRRHTTKTTTDQAIRLYMAAYHAARADRKLPGEAREAAEQFLRGSTVPPPVAAYAIAEMGRAARAGMLP